MHGSICKIKDVSCASLNILVCFTDISLCYSLYSLKLFCCLWEFHRSVTGNEILKSNPNSAARHVLVKVRLPLTCSMYLDIQHADYFYDFCLEEVPHPSSSHLAVVAQRTIFLISILKQSILRCFFLNTCALVKH